MHPASSVIFFTSLSGLGYGLIVALCLTKLCRLHEIADIHLAIGLIVGVVIAAFGLSLSLFHLGHPERAWRALSQWRSSWLSREGVLALLAFMPVTAIIAALLFLGSDTWSGLLYFAYIAAAVLSIATVYATAMIYRTLRTIHAWHNNWVTLGYLTLSVTSGFLFANAYLHTVNDSASMLPYISVVLIAASAIIKLMYWRHIQHSQSSSNASTALGLRDVKQVTQFTAPHTEDNYLLSEMGFQIARTHADKLRRISIALGFVLSFVFLLPYFLHLDSLVTISLWMSVVAVMVGIFVERWLFFAEAKHTVTLYYGR